jgi:hypothetical protein
MSDFTYNLLNYGVTGINAAIGIFTSLMGAKIIFTDSQLGGDVEKWKSA